VNGYTLHPSASGLLVVAVEVPAPSFWLPPAAAAALPRWRAEWREKRRRGEERGRTPYNMEEATTVGTLRRTLSNAELYRFMFGIAALTPRANVLDPLDAEFGPGWGSTMIDIESLPETE
jgi:hypothetical protein